MAVCVSLYANVIFKDMNSAYLTPAMGKLKEKTTKKQKKQNKNKTKTNKIKQKQKQTKNPNKMSFTVVGISSQ